MAFELPDLDRKSYEQLVAEMIRLIPQYTTEWTNYNDSDPGITLVQLLAWIDESLLYQLNAIPLSTQQNFVRWVTGLAYSSNSTDYSQYAESIDDYAFLDMQKFLDLLPKQTGPGNNKYELQKAVLEYTDKPYQALTLNDIHSIAMETNQVIAENDAQREQSSHGTIPKSLYISQAYVEINSDSIQLYVLSDLSFNYTYPEYPNHNQFTNQSGTTRKTLLLKESDKDLKQTQDDLQSLVSQTQQHILPRVLLGTNLQVALAQFTDIDLNLELKLMSNTVVDVTLNAMFTELFNFFLPLKNGAGDGWQYNDAPEQQQIHQLIYAVPGVEAIVDLQLTYYPTIVLNKMAQLSCNSLLADLPAGETDMFYVGIPRLRCLDVIATQSHTVGTK